MDTYSYGETPVKVIKRNMASSLISNYFHIEEVGEGRLAVIETINQGIDSHLEAYTESKFTDNGRRLICDFSQKDMLIFLRRLHELDTLAAMSLRMAILENIGIEEI